MASELKPQTDYAFEISWEVCNKVGGIYTVIREKAPFMVSCYKNYYAVGPYLGNNSLKEFREEKPPQEWNGIFKSLAIAGVECHYGKWLIPGEPNAILIGFDKLLSMKNGVKSELWENYKVDSLRSGWDFEEPMLWSKGVTMLLDRLGKLYAKDKIVAHCHEWLAGFIVLNLKSLKSKIKTIFTTHATMLGRSLAGSGEAFYEKLGSVNPEESAYKLHVEDKFTVERATAQTCDIFTTVSEVTAVEAEKILGRKPDILLLNGMNSTAFPTIEETSIKHVFNRDKIREFLKYYFLPYYKMDVSKNLIFYTSCRYEFKNKGLDILIEALAKLDKELQDEQPKDNIIFFFWVPMAVKRIKSTLSENRDYYFRIKEYVNKHINELSTNITDEFISAKGTEEASGSINKFMQNIRKETLHFKRSGNPPIATHEIENEEFDAVISTLKANGLDNSEESKVKVIVYPVYLTGNDGLSNLFYYDAIAGAHLGVFPSYYEPWGYTPLESGALGVPAITTDLAGFGKFIESQKTWVGKGIYLLKRLGIKREDVVEQLYKLMSDFFHLSHEDRVNQKIIAKELTGLVEWKILVCNYIQAHNMALEK
ncbi:MAG: glycogen/starch synthase [bacterium]